MCSPASFFLFCCLLLPFWKSTLLNQIPLIDYLMYSLYDQHDTRTENRQREGGEKQREREANTEQTERDEGRSRGERGKHRTDREKMRGEAEERERQTQNRREKMRGEAERERGRGKHSTDREQSKTSSLYSNALCLITVQTWHLTLENKLLLLTQYFVTLIRMYLGILKH